MCGLPTEEDEDVLAIADLATEVIRTGREVTGRKDIRCTVSIGGFVPKPQTPFQWAGQTPYQDVDSRLRKLRDALRGDRKYGKSVGLRYHEGRPSIIEGLLSRGDRRVSAVIEEVWDAGDRFDGWSEHFSYELWEKAAEAALEGQPVDLDWFTTRERDEDEILPWDHLDAGLDRDWLWQDWQDSLHGEESSRSMTAAGALLRLRGVPQHGHGDPDQRPRRGPADVAADGRVKPVAHTKKASRSVGPGGLRRFELKM